MGGRRRVAALAPAVAVVLELASVSAAPPCSGGYHVLGA
jgi:hypothetical protein